VRTRRTLALTLRRRVQRRVAEVASIPVARFDSDRELIEGRSEDFDVLRLKGHAEAIDPIRTKLLI
jgi:hypothetical protein